MRVRLLPFNSRLPCSCGPLERNQVGGVVSLRMLSWNSIMEWLTQIDLLRRPSRQQRPDKDMTHHNPRDNHYFGSFSTVLSFAGTLITYGAGGIRTEVCYRYIDLTAPQVVIAASAPHAQPDP